MPQYKQVKSLEMIALRALTIYVSNLGEELMPLYSKVFELTLPELHLDLMDLNGYEENFEDDIDFLDDIEQIRKIAQRRRKSSAKTDDGRRNSFTQKKLQEVQRERVSILHDIFQYNIPCYLFDRLRMCFFHEIPKMVERIKERRTIRTTQGEINSQMNVAVSLIETVIGPYLTYCNFEETPKVLQQTFYTHLKDLKGLEFLNLGSLSGGWKTDEMETTVSLGLEQMANLQYLSLNYDCTDNLLLKLIDTCPKLKSLDISSSKSVTNDSINLLIRIPTLRFVNLHRTSVTMEGYIKLLLGLTNLEDVGRFDDIGRCLEYIVENYPSFVQFALRKFCSRFVTTRFLQIISEYCPEMQHVSIFFNMLLCDLTALIGINKLSVLHLLSCDFFSDQIRDVLAVKGCNLTHLHLEHVDQIDMNALMYISQYCPDLKVFTIYNCEMIESTSLYLQKPSIPPFMNLEKLTIVAQCDYRHLEFLWSTCLRIKSIKCGMMVPTTDELFDRVLIRNPMEHLEELSILRSDGLTICMAYKLVEICPKLAHLNELEGWNLIKEDQLQLFKTFIKTNNLDLNLESRRFQTTYEELL